MLRIELNEELYLALREEQHAAESAALIDCNRAYLRRWLPWVDHNTSEADSLKSIRLNRTQYRHQVALNLGIWYRQKLAGMVGFHHLDHLHKKTSLGYWLSEALQGKGIMTMCCRKMIDFAFTELGFNRVEIRCAENNYPSRAIPQRLGFSIEGTLRQNEWLYDHYVDHIVYGILKKDWMHPWTGPEKT